MHVCLNEYGQKHMRVCTCVRSSKADVENFPRPLFYLTLEAGSLNQSKFSDEAVVSLFGGSYLFLLRLELQVGHHT